MGRQLSVAALIVRVIGASLLTIACLLAGAGRASAASTARTDLAHKALSLSDTPSGWSIDRSANGATQKVRCLASLTRHFTGEIRVAVAFVDGQAPALEETLETGPTSALRNRYTSAIEAYASCKQFSLTIDGQAVTGSVSHLSFPKVGDQSRAFAITLTVSGSSGGIDVVLFKVGRIVGDVLYESVGQPDLGQFHDFTKEAIAKIEGRATSTPVPGPTSTSSSST